VGTFKQELLEAGLKGSNKVRQKFPLCEVHGTPYFYLSKCTECASALIEERRRKGSSILIKGGRSHAVP